MGLFKMIWRYPVCLKKWLSGHFGRIVRCIERRIFHDQWFFCLSEWYDLFFDLFFEIESGMGPGLMIFPLTDYHHIALHLLLHRCPHRCTRLWNSNIKIILGFSVKSDWTTDRQNVRLHRKFCEKVLTQASYFNTLNKRICVIYFVA